MYLTQILEESFKLWVLKPLWVKGLGCSEPRIDTSIESSMPFNQLAHIRCEGRVSVPASRAGPSYPLGLSPLAMKILELKLVVTLGRRRCKR